MTWVLEKFKKSYSIMCGRKKAHSNQRRIFHSKILVQGFDGNTLWFNLLKKRPAGRNRYQPEEVYFEVISVCSIRIAYDNFYALGA
jgi:hypothetical protein